MLDPHREIQALVDNFVADLSALAKRIAIEQVKVAFDVGTKSSSSSGSGSGARPSAAVGTKSSAVAKPFTGVGAKRSAGVGAKPSAGVGAKRSAGAGRSRSAGVAVKPPAGVAAKPAPAPAPVRASRARRGQEEIEALRGKLLAAIAEQPGRRTEDLNAALGTTTAQIAQLLRRLVADKLVRTEGARRGMRYFAAAAGDGQNGRRAAASAAASAAVAAEAAADAAAETAAASGEPTA